MAFKTFAFLVCVASIISVILSHPQNPVGNDQVPPRPSVNLDLDRLPNVQTRTFGSLLNLSAYLQNAPENSSALNFVPLITILSALG